METQILLTILASGGVVVAIIGGIREALSFHRERKAKKEDAQIIERLDKIENKIEELQQRSDAQKEGLKFVLYDRIRHIGTCYVKEKQVDIDDRRILNDMHKSYHYGLDGNGDLDLLMSEVNSLPLKIEK